MTQKKKLTYDQAKDLLLPIGKYKGEKIGDVVAIDKPYLEWMLDSINLPAWLEDAIVMMLSEGRVGSIR